MAQRQFTITGQIRDITNAAVAFAPCTAQVLTPTGDPAIDGNGALIGTQPASFAADANGVVSQTLDYPGDFQTAFQDSQIRLVLNGLVVDSPIGVGYAGTIAFTAWIGTPSVAGLVRMRAVYTQENNAGIGGALGSVQLARTATVVATGQILSVASPVQAISAADGTLLFDLNPNSLLNPSNLTYQLRIANEVDTWIFQVPAVVDVYKGAWNAATTYAAAGGSSNGDVVILSGVLYRCILGNTNQTPPNATYWTALPSSGAGSLPTDLVTAHLQGSARTGVVAIDATNILHDSNVPALVDDPVASPITLDDDLHNLAARIPGNRRTIATSAAINAVTDDVLFCNAGGGAIAPTLPLAASRTRKLYCIKIDNNANVTLTASGSDTINGVGTLVLNTQYQWAVLESDGGTNWYAQTGIGGGSFVTSVGLSMPPQFNVSGSPVTSSGTLNAGWNSQAANTVLAGPASGGAAGPTFRAPVAADIPSLDASKIATGTMAASRLPLGTASAPGIVQADGSSITATGGVISASGSATDATTTAVGVVEIDRAPLAGHPRTTIRQDNVLGSSSAAAQPPVPVSTVDLIDALRGGYHSDRLFTINPGVNEFDIQYVGGIYYLCYDDQSQGVLKHASTVAGLASASVDNTFSLRYPTLFYDGTLWHVWANDISAFVVHHYTSSSFTGAFTDIGTVALSNVYEMEVRQNPVDGKYYAGYIDVTIPTAPQVAMLVSTDLVTWTKLGRIFSTIGRPGWASVKTFDAVPIFWQGRTYMAFHGWDGVVQRVGVVELDPSNNYQAINTAVVVVDWLETWQQSGSSNGVFHPIWLAHPQQPGQERLYYSQATTTPSAGGFSYVQVGPTPADGRRPLDGLRLNTATGLDVASGIGATAHGGAVFGGMGLACSAAPSGAYGWLNLYQLADFTMAIAFSLYAIPGSDGLLCRASPASMGTNQVALYITSAGVLKAVIIGSTTLTLTGSTTLAIGATYRAILRRIGSEVRLYLAAHQETSGTQGDTLTGLVEWSVANDKGTIQAAGEQLSCTILGAVLCGEALQLTTDPLLGLPLGASGGGGSYTLPVASTTILGGVKIGPNSVALGLEAVDGTIGVGTEICMQTGTSAPPVPLWTSDGADYVYMSA